MTATLHLVDLLGSAAVEAPGPQHVEPRQLHVGADSRAGLFQHPPSVVRFALPSWAGDGRLETAAGVTNAVLGRIGGPVAFRVGTAAAPGADVEWLATRVLDGREEKPEGWVDVAVEFAGAAEIVLATEADDAAHAWVGWADPLVRPRGEPPAPRRRRPPPTAHHVLLVTADALRADHLLGREVRTPRIDALREAGAIAFVARAASTTTPGSYASLLTGRLPHHHGVLEEWGALPAHLPTLPTELARAGARTVFAPSERELGEEPHGFARVFADVVECRANPWQDGAATTRALLAHLDGLEGDEPLLTWVQYFDAHPPRAYPADLVAPYYEGDPRSPERRHRPEDLARVHGAEVVLELVRALPALRAGTADGSFVARLRAVVDHVRGDRPTGPDLSAHLAGLGPRATDGLSLSAFAEWLAPHVEALERGDVPEELVAWLERVLPLLREIERDALSWLDGVVDLRYPLAHLRAGAAHVDAQVGALLDGLAARGLLEHTTLVVASPHGELLGEGGHLLNHHPPLEPVLRAPVVVAPAATLRERLVAPRGPVELVDLLPTVLALSGLSVPDALDGRNRLTELRGGAPLPPQPQIAVGQAGQHVAVTIGPHKLVRTVTPFAHEGRVTPAGADAWFDIAGGGDQPCTPPPDVARTAIALADRVVASLPGPAPGGGIARATAARGVPGAH